MLRLFVFLLCRTTEHVLKLEDPNSLEDDMGVIVLNLNLVVKQGDFKRHVSVTLLSLSSDYWAS
jgi:hypothetical protein